MVGSGARRSRIIRSKRSGRDHPWCSGSQLTMTPLSASRTDPRNLRARRAAPDGDRGARIVVPDVSCRCASSGRGAFRRGRWLGPSAFSESRVTTDAGIGEPPPARSSSIRPAACRKRSMSCDGKIGIDRNRRRAGIWTPKMARTKSKDRWGDAHRSPDIRRRRPPGDLRRIVDQLAVGDRPR
jgi:hypothetical protein